MQSSTVFVVTDDTSALNVLTDLFQQAKLFHSEIFTSAETFLAKFDPERPGCLLLDMSLPGISGIELHRILVQRQSVSPVIVLTNQSELRSAMEVLKGGAVDYFEKPFDSNALVAAITLAIEMDSANRRALWLRSEVLHRFAKLTRREREIMDIMLGSKSSREIADQLNISARTVEFYRARIMKKMEAASLVELVRMVAMAFGCHCIHKHKYLNGVTLPSNIISTYLNKSV